MNRWAAALFGGFVGGTTGSACACPISVLSAALLSFDRGGFGFSEPVWLLSWGGMAVCGAVSGAALGYGLGRRSEL